MMNKKGQALVEYILIIALIKLQNPLAECLVRNMLKEINLEKVSALIIRVK